MHQLNQPEETALYSLFQRLKQTDIEADREAYEEVESDAEKLEWLKALSSDLQDAVDTKEREIDDLESEVGDLRAVLGALEAVTHRVKLRLGIETVEGQLPLPETATDVVESGV